MSDPHFEGGLGTFVPCGSWPALHTGQGLCGVTGFFPAGLASSCPLRPCHSDPEAPFCVCLATVRALNQPPSWSTDGEGHVLQERAAGQAQHGLGDMAMQARDSLHRERGESKTHGDTHIAIPSRSGVLQLLALMDGWRSCLGTSAYPAASLSSFRPCCHSLCSLDDPLQKQPWPKS